ncbi:MAG TPA: AbrB/MazE/SpoVT family DNA-binding domain-containing protein [Nitriliruptorales bacterium]|nr:AbrB/MazE/SpoVT family DNA-binding domain-containing protein [Nitriliruptorales bacterium]
MRTGIQRKVDDLGRVVIPAGIRHSLNIREGDALEVHVDGDQVILSKPTDQCVFCGGAEELVGFRGRSVCRPCIAGVGVLGDGIRRAQSAATRVQPRGSEVGWPAGGPTGPTPGVPAPPAARPAAEPPPLRAARSWPAAATGPPGAHRDEPPSSTTAW